MDKDYTNLNHLYIRLPERNDADLIKAWAKDYYDNQMMPKKTYDFWLNRDYNDYFNKKEDEIKGLSTGAMLGVHCYTYYLIENGNIVGIGSLRLNPENNPELNIYGGHIGYGTIPSKRKQGYGTMFLHLLIKTCATFGLEEITVVCAEDNIGSSHVIENNLGILSEIVYDPNKESNFKRYTIDVNKSIVDFEIKYLKKFKDSQRKVNK